MTNHGLQLKAIAQRRAMLNLIVIMTQSHSAAILAEAFGNYFGWEVCNHDERTK